MLTIIPTRSAEVQIPGAICVSEGKSIAEKYNRTIDSERSKGYSGWIELRHDDAEILSPPSEVEELLETAYSDHQLVCGVIGTLNLETSLHWWIPHRHINGVGSIWQQVDPSVSKSPIPPEVAKNGKYKMSEWEGYHRGVASVDGCCIWIHTDALDKIRFDENLPAYHFYDVDICLQALSKGIGVCVIPVEVLHKSSGANPSELDKMREDVFAKWNKRVDVFPININTKFIEEEEN